MRLEKVVVKVPLRRKRLRAVLRRTMIRLFTCMKPQMRLQVSLFVEGFLAVLKGANKVSRPIVLLQVHFQALLSTVRLVTTLNGADKVLLLLVCFSVISQVTLGHERFVAARVRTSKRTIILQLKEHVKDH